MSDITTLMMGAAGQVGGDYQIERSLRFNSADSAYLSRTPASAGNRKTWTWSGWVKRSAVGSIQYFYGASPDSYVNTFAILSFGSNDFLRIQDFQSGGFVCRLETTQVFRDVSAWYHIVFSVDTTQATDTNRVKFYVNGSQITEFSTTTYPTQNADLVLNNNVFHNVGYISSTNNFNGYLADINFIDGQALTPSSFGEVDEVTGVWKPIRYAGTYGTNGFRLSFSDSSSTTALGYDAAGSNDWTPNNFSVTAGAGNDSLVDSPTPYGTDTGAGGEVRGNYCTFNPLDKSVGTKTITNGNLDTANDGNGSTFGNFGMSSGKWYFELTLNSIVGSTASTILGITASTANKSSTNPQNETPSVGYVSDGNKIVDGAATAYGATYTTNDVIGVAVDIDSGSVTFYKNGASQGAISKTLAGQGTGFYLLYTVAAASGATNSWTLNAGQRPFAHTPPSGFKALVTTNLPDPTVVQGDDYFNTVLYTGTGSSLGVTGVGFQPDFVWIKERSGAADHALYDAVRGVQQQLESNTTTDETTESTGLTAFGTNGFTVGSLAQVNTSTDTYVAWNWKESTVSKFDIVTYTGNGTARTISHNLGVVPNMIIVKARTTASTDQGWPVYHSANTANPETDYLLLNDTAATADLDTVWNDTAPTSSVFSVGTNALVNANNDTYVAYLFANVAGYSAFGSYTGNASADGPFVYTGFRPEFILIKGSTIASNWQLLDATRNPYNAAQNFLRANTNIAEATNYPVDFLSNGFKLRNTDSDYQDTSPYIYIAFASNPFKYALAR